MRQMFVEKSTLNFLVSVNFSVIFPSVAIRNSRIPEFAIRAGFIIFRVSDFAL